MASRGTLAAVLLAVVLGLAVPALCDKQGASQAALAVDYHAFEKALEGLDPATRQAIGDATVQLVRDSLDAAKQQDAAATAATPRSRSRSHGAVDPTAGADAEEVADQAVDDNRVND